MDADLEFPLVRPERMTAIEWADWIDRCQVTYKQETLDRLGMLWLAEDLAAARKSKYNVQVTPENRPLYNSALLNAGDWAIHLMWKQHKVVYAVDSTLQESLADMETTDVLPGEILRQLPHPNPLFIWPAGHEVTAHSGGRAIVRAMYVNGKTAANDLCLTSDPAVATYQLTFTSDLLDAEGKVEATDSVRMSFELTPKATSINKIVSEVLKDFRWEPLAKQQAPLPVKVAYMQALARFGIAHLLYTCSDKADVEKPVASRTIAKGKNKGQPTKGATLAHPLGYRIGAAIRSVRERVERDSQSSLGGTSRTVKPHIRKAHLHTFRHGPGRVLSKVKWLPPIFVSSSGVEYATEGVIVPVKL